MVDSSWNKFAKQPESRPWQKPTRDPNNATVKFGQHLKILQQQHRLPVSHHDLSHHHQRHPQQQTHLLRVSVVKLHQLKWLMTLLQER